jgi:hypothetical protein
MIDLSLVKNLLLHHPDRRGPQLHNFMVANMFYQDFRKSSSDQLFQATLAKSLSCLSKPMI